MINWLIKRGIQKHNSEFNDSVKSSFLNIKNDMAQISDWINHFKNRDQFHHGNFHSVLQKLENLEENLQKLEEIEERVKKLEGMGEKLDSLEQKGISESSAKPIYESSFNSVEDHPKWLTLTKAQMNLIRVISGISKENPDKWFTFRDIAEEAYHDKSYDQVKSTLIKYLNLLEGMGYVERKRSGNQVLLRISENVSPPKERLVIDMKVSKKSKKKAKK
jgi:hypothetical protein